MIKELLIFVLLISFSFLQLNAQQNVSISDVNSTPEASSVLDVSSTTKGMLIPRVALTATNAASPITLPQTSLLVYNTATAGIIPNNVTPGYYYNSGTPTVPNWSRLNDSPTTGTEWKLLGNAGTNATTNFLGTTDNIDLVFKTNNVEKMRILSGGNIGVGTASPSQKLDVVGNVQFSQALMPNGNAGTSGQALISQGAGTAPIWSNVNSVLVGIKVFTSGTSQTYTVPSGVNKLHVKLVGGGGGGGGSTNPSTAANVSVAGGGGGGGYCEGLISTSQGSTFTYSVGTGGTGGTGANAGTSGGTTTLGTYSATGGGGGNFCTSINGTGQEILGGAGGIGSGSDLNLSGSTGGSGFTLNKNVGISGIGGTTILYPSGGGQSRGAILSNNPGGSKNGNSALTNSGCGGSGGYVSSCDTCAIFNSTGGNGAAGIIIIYEYK